MPGRRVQPRDGPGSQVGKAAARAEGRAVTFTGSVDTGRKVAADCVARGAKVQLEMGGKNPMVVLDDADLEHRGRVRGQQRLLLDRPALHGVEPAHRAAGIHDRFVDAVGQMPRPEVDDALKAGTDIGPVVSQDQLDQDSPTSISAGRGRAPRPRRRAAQPRDAGYYLAPALFVDTTNDMRINRDEIFGPVASVIRVKDYEEAVAVANDTPFGLSPASARRPSNTPRLQAPSDAGMVMVNLPTAGVDYHVPFGGRKGRSYGPREQGAYAREFYTSVKTTYTPP